MLWSERYGVGLFWRHEPATPAEVELHIHLDSSLSYAAIARLAPEVTREEYQRESMA